MSTRALSSDSEVTFTGLRVRKRLYGRMVCNCGECDRASFDRHQSGSVRPEAEEEYDVVGVVARRKCLDGWATCRFRGGPTLGAAGEIAATEMGGCRTSFADR